MIIVLDSRLFKQIFSLRKIKNNALNKSVSDSWNVQI